MGIKGIDITPRLVALFGLKPESGVLVQAVIPGSPAAKAGIRGGEKVILLGEEKIILGGDVIVGIEGRPVKRVLDIVQELTRHRPGEKISLKILRGEKELTVSLTLGSLNPANLVKP